MHRRSLAWGAAFLSALCATGQRTVAEAVHRDTTGRVWYLEREYDLQDGGARWFAEISSDGGRAFRRSVEQHGDTVIERNACYDLPQLCRWQLGTNSGSDPEIEPEQDHRRYTWRSPSYMVYFDTLVPYDKIEEFETWMKQFRWRIAELVHNGKMSFDLDKRELVETWTWRTVKNKLLDRVVSDEKGVLVNRQSYEQGDTLLVAQKYAGGHRAAYEVDSLRWDLTRTSYRLAENVHWDSGWKSYLSSWRRSGDSTIEIGGEDTTWTKWRYFKRPWAVVLRNAVLGEGPLCDPEMLNWEEALPEEERSTHNNPPVRYENTLDDKGRPLQIKKFNEGRLSRIIDFSYW